MEDISRELEREIAQIKPAPYTMRKESCILIIDAFGEIRSGSFLKVLIYIFLVISLIGGLGTAGFYWFYAKANSRNLQLISSQDANKKKIERLTNEKEILMARLVMTGNATELEALTRVGKLGQDAPKKEKRSGMKGKKESLDVLSVDIAPDSKIAEEEDIVSDNKGAAESESQAAEHADPPIQQSPDELSNVGIGSFSFSSGRHADELIVRFNVRNTTKKSKEISGRIFCVLKPTGATPDKWVVAPKGSVMKKGVPGPYKQGQYFSISSYKPVQFTIKTKTPLKDFSDTSIFIFDETEKLLFKTTIDTGKNKQD
nr:hypothetical protein [uncultured Desulfobacter sp.]